MNRLLMNGRDGGLEWGIRWLQYRGSVHPSGTRSNDIRTSYIQNLIRLMIDDISRAIGAICTYHDLVAVRGQHGLSISLNGLA